MFIPPLPPKADFRGDFFDFTAKIANVFEVNPGTAGLILDPNFALGMQFRVLSPRSYSVFLRLLTNELHAKKISRRNGVMTS